MWHTAGADFAGGPAGVLFLLAVWKVVCAKFFARRLPFGLLTHTLLCSVVVVINLLLRGFFFCSAHFRTRSPFSCRHQAVLQFVKHHAPSRILAVCSVCWGRILQHHSLCLSYQLAFDPIMSIFFSPLSDFFAIPPAQSASLVPQAIGLLSSFREAFGLGI